MSHGNSLLIEMRAAAYVSVFPNGRMVGACGCGEGDATKVACQAAGMYVCHEETSSGTVRPCLETRGQMLCISRFQHELDMYKVFKNVFLPHLAQL